LKPGCGGLGLGLGQVAGACRGLPAQEGLVIPSGATEAELWEIFHQLAREVHKGDKLYVDVTHGFRTLPIVLVMALDCLRSACEVHVVQVTYGAFDACSRDSDDPRPTFDLTPFFVLQEWTSALALLEAGDLKALGRVMGVASNNLGRLLKAERPWSLRRLPKLLEQLGDALWCNRLRALPDLVTRTREQLGAVRQDLAALRARARTEPALAPVAGGLEPLQAVLAKLEHKIGALAPEPGAHPIAYGILAARFLIRHHLVVQGLTLLRESLLDIIAERLGVSEKPRRDIDPLFGTVVAVHGCEIPSRHHPTESFLPTFERLVEAIADPSREALGGLDAFAQLGKLACQIGAMRNPLNHAGTDAKAMISTTQRLEDRGLEFCDELSDLLDGLPDAPPS